MTNLSRITLLGAVALLAAVGCQREPAVDNPNFNSEDNSVTTQLVLNISTQTSQDQQTKQDPGVAQTGASPAFRGINDAFLLPVIQDTDGQILPADMAAASVIDLSDVLNTSGTLPAHSSRIMEVQLPLKTNTLLFYAKAPMGTTAGYDMETDYKGMNIYDIYGKLDNYNIGKNKGSANFRLGVRMANTPSDPTLVDRFNSVQTVFSSIMTILMNFGLNTANVTHEALTTANYGYDFNATPGVYNASTTPYSYPEIRWKDYVNATGTSPVDPSHALYSLEKKLATLYTQITTINATEGELRAASGEANLRMIQDLWTVINEIRCATPSSPAEAVAKYFATKLDARLSAFLNTTKHANDGSAIEGVSYKETSTLLTLLAADVDKWWPAEDATTTTPAHTTSNPGSAGLTALISTIGTDNNILTDFPHNFNLPRGATHVVYDADHLIFKYPEVFNTTGMGTAGSYGATNYYYPSELLYFGNSPIRVTDNDKRASDYPLANSWMTDAWTGWDSGADGYVKSTTRAVAMQNEINYGSALLETKVGYNVGVLEDHRHYVMKSFAGTGSAISDDKDGDGHYVDEPNQLITVTDGLFTLTGIIIGGQSQNVGWSYLPYYEVNADGTLPDVPKMVYGFLYDRAIDPAARTIPALTSSTSSPNYTLVFDNLAWDSEDAAGFFTPSATQATVSIALEFRNNGDDFYGNFNLVRSGGYFYLIGSLDPTAGTGTINWNRTAGDQHVIPPYKIDGTGNVVSTETKRVFIQDHKTSVTFRFNQYSLQHAYLTVPDLRSSSLSLGLDVDLNWETGLTFNNIGLGGGEVN